MTVEVVIIFFSAVRDVVIVKISRSQGILCLTGLVCKPKPFSCFRVFYSAANCAILGGLTTNRSCLLWTRVQPWNRHYVLEIATVILKTTPLIGNFRGNLTNAGAVFFLQTNQVRGVLTTNEPFQQVIRNVLACLH